MLGIVTLYAISVAGAIALLFAWWASHRGTSYARLRCWILSHIVYPLFPSWGRIFYRLHRIFYRLFRRIFYRFPLQTPRRPRRWYTRRWTSVTYIDLILLGVYVFVNVFCLGFGIGSVDKRRVALIRRSSVLSSVNTVLLFLGGRTNILIDAFDIPLHSYYLAHHWIGRMAVAQGLFHAGLAISQNWTLDERAISGLLVGSLS
jgi:hypothetical protein